MPDLIIKPTATSGNKLILKDQAGGAVLTTADSGATAANVTLASTTTFPAGHILHVQQNVISGSGASQAFTSSNASTWYATGNSITVASANAALGSKILIMYEHMFGVNPGSASQQLTYKIKRTAPSVSDNLGFRLYDGLQTNTTGYYRFSASGSIIDESLGSGDHTYTLEFTATHASLAATVYYNWYADSSYTGKNRMIAMVIK